MKHLLEFEDWLNEKGLWDNIRAKRARGEKPARKGSAAYKKAVAAAKKIKNESFLTEAKSDTYENWEKGVIKAWGELMYLGFHSVPKRLDNLSSFSDFRNEFDDYFRNSEDDEDLRDWMSGTPPTYAGGKESLYDKERMEDVLSEIANKTKLKKPLVVYRFEEKEMEGWNSYTTDPSKSYRGKRRSYLLPVGKPVIFTEGLADEDEVIVHLTANEKKKFKT